MDFRDRQRPVSRHELFFKLYGNCQNRLYVFLYMMVHNENDAEDLLQETVTSLWERFDKFRPDSNFTAWAMTIARRKAINFLKKNARSRPHLSDGFYQQIADLEIEEDDLSERSEALKHCLKRLREIDRRLLLMRYERNISMVKIAEIFGRSTNGIYHTMSRIHSVLRQCIHRLLTTGHSG